MRKLCEKDEVLFAILWIAVYSFGAVPLRGVMRADQIWTAVPLLVFLAGMIIYVKRNHLEEKYGLKRWQGSSRRYLYFVPLWALSTGNIWQGVSPAYSGTVQVYAVLCMLLSGYEEEMLFRGFLFQALISKGGKARAVILSSVLFGISHMLNLFSGQTIQETVLQVVFALCCGFLFSMVVLYSGSLIPCVVAHMIINILSLFSDKDVHGEGAYVLVTVIITVFYSLYLRKPEK